MADDKCRKCWESTEIIEQITEAVSPNYYWVYQSCNNVAKTVHQQLTKGMQLCTLIVPYNRYQLTEILEHKSLNYNGGEKSEQMCEYRLTAQTCSATRGGKKLILLI
jgi:hypothetical protein